MPQRPRIQQKLLDLKGTKTTVQQLMLLFEIRVRDHRTIPVIDQALRDAGLATVPSFDTCGHRAEIELVDWESGAAAAADDAEALADEDLAPGALPQRPLRIGDLPTAGTGIDSVRSDHQLTDATHLMRARNYSQVPVLDDQYTLRGVVTWSSVALMYQTGAQPVLANAMVRDTQLSVAEVHQDFFALLPQIGEYGYVLVRGNHGRFTGIVTAADITERFEATARPFFLVGEIESRLRKCLGAAISAEAIKAVQDRRRQTGLISDLMFNQYVKLLDGNQQAESLRPGADQNWQTLGWTGVGRLQFVSQLDRVRVIRNKIAHFDPEPLTEGLNEELRQFVLLLRQLT